MTPKVLIARLVALAAVVAVLGCIRTEMPKPVMLEAPRCAFVPAGRDWGFYAFFDQHSDHINARMQYVLTEMSKTFLNHHISALEMLAFTDSSEITAPDRDLDARRARAVQAFLSTAGVPPEIVVIKNFGASRPWVPTPPGVPEGQNRRVELHPFLHSTDEELHAKHDCEAWLRDHKDECETKNAIENNIRACKQTKSALRSWYLPD